ncbi:hypothetical protein [Paraburkholderia xenovorans]|nr:hypothetical protein [Paraburkholderia xenovorans]
MKPDGHKDVRLFLHRMNLAAMTGNDRVAAGSQASLRATGVA